MFPVTVNTIMKQDRYNCISGEMAQIKITAQAKNRKASIDSCSERHDPRWRNLALERFFIQLHAKSPGQGEAALTNGVTNLQPAGYDVETYTYKALREHRSRSPMLLD